MLPNTATKRREARVTEATELYNQGWTQDRIAEKFGVHQTTVLRWLNPDSYQRVLEKRRTGPRPQAYRKNDKRRRQKTQHKLVTYFIADAHGHVKIGSTKNLKIRLKSLQIAHADDLTVLGTVEKNECELHVKFAHYHVRGEWFLLSDEIKSFIKDQTD